MKDPIGHVFPSRTLFGGMHYKESAHALQSKLELQRIDHKTQMNLKGAYSYICDWI